MQFPDPRDANFLMVCVSGSAAAYVYEPHPRCAPSSPHVSRADGAGESPCPPSVARECPRANAEHDWRVVSSVYGVPPFSQPRCRSASLSCDGLSPSGIWHMPQGALVRHVLADRCHAASFHNDGTGSSGTHAAVCAGFWRNDASHALSRLEK